VIKKMHGNYYGQPSARCDVRIYEYDRVTWIFKEITCKKCREFLISDEVEFKQVQYLMKKMQEHPTWCNNL